MDYQVIATRGHGGYRQYRIPAMAVTNSGRIVTIYDARVDLDDLPGPIDLVIRISDDNGESWTPQKLFLASDGITGYGDASITFDPNVGEKGRIIVFCQVSNLASFFESSFGCALDDLTVVHISLSISDDDGETWSHKILTDQVKDQRTHGIFASSGMGGCIQNGPFAGRLIHSFVLRRGSELLGALAFSDDHGNSWKLGAEIPNGNESGVACLNDGTILVHSRSTPFRLSGKSLDGSKTLSELRPHSELPDPSDNGSLATLKSGEVICTHNHDSDLRRRTVAKLSKDGGVTWPKALVLEAESSAYSTACELADGRIGVLFERYGYTEIVFCRFSLDELQETEQALPIEKDENGIEFQVTFRYVKPGRNKEIQERLTRLVKYRIPSIDMSLFRISERKEIGSNSGSASGEPIFSKKEYDEILGPVSPGFRVGDELRFSGRLQNHSPYLLSDLKIESPCEGNIDTRINLESGQKITFMDLRYQVCSNDLESEKVCLAFNWSAVHPKLGVVNGHILHQISTKTGLSIL